MKTVGDILSSFLGEGFAKKAHGYSNLFDSWEDITNKNGIAAASTHSRIKELVKGIITIEMDHPGWKQILQTKQSKILNDFRIRFPEMDISGISLVLGKPDQNDQPEKEKIIIDNESYEILNTTSVSSDLSVPLREEKAADSKQSNSDDSTASYIDAIKDEELKEKLLKIGQAIAEREGKK